MDYKSVIIIGAPRSGTNMLRDVLCELDGVGTWPCDEINYIWRHGNIGMKTDQFSSEMASSKICGYVRSEFEALARKNKLKVVVEKTCANSLRVPFVDKVIPEARYVFIVRNGYDALASANLRWKAKLNIGYLLQKVRYVPLLDLPFYAAKYCMNRVYRLFSKNERLAFWGPQLNDMDILLKDSPLDTVCAIQWQRCVELAGDALSRIAPERVVRVKYEAFVKNPSGELARIVENLGISASQEQIVLATQGVRANSIGKGKRQLDHDIMESLKPVIGKTLNKYGYK